jgi:hypothetical protein
MRTVDPSGYRIREGATDWWRIRIIRVIIAEVIDKAICTQGGACASETPKRFS